MFRIRRLILSAAMFASFCVWLVDAGVVLGEPQPSSWVPLAKLRFASVGDSQLLTLDFKSPNPSGLSPCSLNHRMFSFQKYHSVGELLRRNNEQAFARVGTGKAELCQWHPAAGNVSVAVPEAASAKPAKPRKVLVLTESTGALATAQKVSGHKFVPHESAPHCAEAVVELGRKTGAFEATVVTDAEGFTRENLNAYDAVVLANVKQNRLTTGLNAVEVMNVLLPQSNRAYEQSIALQNHTEPLEFQNIYIKGTPAEPAKK